MNIPVWVSSRLLQNHVTGVKSSTYREILNNIYINIWFQKNKNTAILKVLNKKKIYWKPNGEQPNNKKTVHIIPEKERYICCTKAMNATCSKQEVSLRSSKNEEAFSTENSTN